MSEQYKLKLLQNLGNASQSSYYQEVIRAWWCMTLISALRKQRQLDL